MRDNAWSAIGVLVGVVAAAGSFMRPDHGCYDRCQCPLESAHRKVSGADALTTPEESNDTHPAR
jgi:hypothetical protein